MSTETKDAQPSYRELTDDERETLRLGHEKSVGQVIRDAREGKGYGQRELAEIIKISPSQYNRIEGNISRPSRESLKKISAFLGIEYGELVRLAGFSALKEDKRLFNKKGEEIPTDDIIRAIYRVDSDLLEEFKDFDTFASGEDAKLLKVLLRYMKMNRKEVCEKSGKEESFMNKSFRELIKYILALYE